MIDQATIDRILDAANIVDVVSDYVSLHKRGVNYLGLCPFHSDRTPSFTVSPAKNICKCFACGVGGTPVHFIMKQESLNYFDALRHLAKKYNIDIQERELSDKEKLRQSNRESMFIVNNWAQTYFTDQLYKHEEGKRIGYSYFAQRGFRDDIIKKFQLGYSLEKRDALVQEAAKKGYKKEYIEGTGLAYMSDKGQLRDRFRGRVIFPVHTLSGKVVAFGGRILKKDAKAAKYVNSPESEIYSKSRELYGIFFAKQAIQKKDHCFLVEGYTDVISMHQAGIENVVASSGTALTVQQIRLIHRFTKNITVLYDGDAAGIKAALRGIDLLLEEGMNVKVVLLPEGEDPDSFARKNNATGFTEFIKNNEVDFIRFKTGLLLKEAGNDPIKLSELVKDITKSIAVIPDEIIRVLYIRECSSMMNIPEGTILDEVKKNRESNTEKSSAQRRYTGQPDGQVNQPAGTGESVEPEQPIEPELPGESSFPVTEPLSVFNEYELALLKYVVRYAGTTLFEYTDPETEEEIVLKVAEYIRKELERDDIYFSLSVYRQILDEAVEKESIQKEKEVIEKQREKEAKANGVEYTRPAGFDNNKFNPQRYFLYHPDQAISKLAVELINERYELSKIHYKYKEQEREEDRLPQFVVKDLFTFKHAFIQQQIEEIDQKIKEAATRKDEDEIIHLMTKKKELNDIRMILSREVGDRIVVKVEFKK
ncbi:MAG: DNA primase [Tannerellaceae bacterium]|nr:DNA primase [Tannerellaceae bacterium]